MDGLLSRFKVQGVCVDMHVHNGIINYREHWSTSVAYI